MAVVSITTLLGLLIQLIFTVRLARSISSTTSLVANLALSALLSLPMLVTALFLPRFPAWHGWRSLVPLLSGYVTLYRHVPGLRGLCIIWLASSIGVAISRVVREMKMLLPVAVALALVDTYVVFGGGLVHQATHGTSEAAASAMQALTVPVAPARTPISGAAPMQLTVGFADYLFTALFFACFARFGIPSRRTFWLLYGALALYSVTVFLGKAEALPALVPIAVVVIGANAKRFKFERSEAFALLYAALIVLLLSGGLYVVYHR